MVVDVYLADVISEMSILHFVVYAALLQIVGGDKLIIPFC
uniref:Uncharacterized protein n=1 Tax=Leclercia adecarboxylata TaxID=83655 RepID=A0A4D5XLR3_9ENTR|nr:Hypothetical protein [Leclercia adecarboxylata]CQB46836.1 hypothetical protein [Vibrio cholerae]